MAVVDPRQVVPEAGDAVGRIVGINHIVLITNDMDATVHFYRDLLGFKVVRTNPPRDLPDGIEMQRQYFFEFPNGELFSFYEVKDTALPNQSIYADLWPDPEKPLPGPGRPHKLDHLAFDVATVEDVVWFQERLKAHGVAVSELVDRKPGAADKTASNVSFSTKFVASIYFYDPSGIPVEIATLDRGSPEWEGYDFTTWFRDPDPVPSLRAGGADGAQ
jgi:catechol 2,3-dioxygenase-like lactoylglutathione lyase family enzyme